MIDKLLKGPFGKIFIYLPLKPFPQKPGRTSVHFPAGIVPEAFKELDRPLNGIENSENTELLGICRKLVSPPRSARAADDAVFLEHTENILKVFF
jgi:hypothetical protein